MTNEQKRYIIVFTGLFLMVLGGLLYLNSQNKKSNSANKKNKPNAELQILIKNAKKPENIFTPYPRPTKVNYIYGEDTKFMRTIPNSYGTISYSGDGYLNNLRLVCGGKNCPRQVIINKRTAKYDIATLNRMIANHKQVRVTKMMAKSTASQKVKTNVIRGDVVITKGELSALKPNTKIVGNVYIKNINSLRIPHNFKVEGDMYVINSEGVTFVGDSRVNGQVYVYGKSSIKAVPSTVKISGQIFV